MKKSKVRIIKANGKEAFFDENRIIHSLKRAGADSHIIDEVLHETKKALYDGISAKEMYRHVFANLKRLSSPIASKYHLKNAIGALGPTGFPFEKFIAALLEGEGYKTQTNNLIAGRCVTHEVDVLAERGSDYCMIECKFHAMEGSVSDIKQALYVYARFLDIKKAWRADALLAKMHHSGWLVTNTRFSTEARKYSKCVGLQLVSWDYPAGNSLRDRIDHSSLYPVTCIAGLNRQEKQRLIDKKIVLCKSLCENPDGLNGIGLGKERKHKILDELQLICENPR